MNLRRASYKVDGYKKILPFINGDFVGMPPRAGKRGSGFIYRCEDCRYFTSISIYVQGVFFDGYHIGDMWLCWQCWLFWADLIHDESIVYHYLGWHHKL